MGRSKFHKVPPVNPTHADLRAAVRRFAHAVATVFGSAGSATWECESNAILRGLVGGAGSQYLGTPKAELHFRWAGFVQADAEVLNQLLMGNHESLGHMRDTYREARRIAECLRSTRDSEDAVRVVADYLEEFRETVWCAPVHPKSGPVARVTGLRVVPNTSPVRYAVDALSPPKTWWLALRRAADRLRTVGGSFPLVLNDLQKDILAALDGRAMSQAALESHLEKDRRQLHRPTGLGDLRARGLVRLQRGVGYYRPDRPPPELVPLALGA